MATLSRQQALERLTTEIRAMGSDDLAEVYSELFPARPREARSRQNVGHVFEQINEHIDKGLQTEEILDLWNVVFPKTHNVYFDEETNVLYYNEDSESVQYVD